MELKVVVTQKGKIFQGKAAEIVNEKLTSAMYPATSFLERKIKAFIRKQPNRRGRGVHGEEGGFISTIHGEVVGKGTPLIKGIVAHQSKHGDVVEKGRTAGKTWPPEGSLLRWIEVKMGVDERTAKRLEFVIRRKIGKKGFEGLHSFEKTLDENWEKIQTIFDKAGFEIARELNE